VPCGWWWDGGKARGRAAAQSERGRDPERQQAEAVSPVQWQRTSDMANYDRSLNFQVLSGLLRLFWLSPSYQPATEGSD
jgi:hypothetical protein